MRNVVLIMLLTVATLSASAVEGLKLFRLEGGEKVPYELRPETKYIALYQSASWCPPCRMITPQLVEEYQRMQKVEQQPVEMVLLGADYSEKDVLKYMESYEMQWPALEWGQIAAVEKYIAQGIPDLILVELATGKVLTKGTGAPGIEEAVARIREYSGLTGEKPFKAKGFLNQYGLIIAVVVSCGLILLLMKLRSGSKAKSNSEPANT